MIYSFIATVIYITIKHVECNKFDALHSYFGHDCVLFARPCLICASYVVFNVNYAWRTCADFFCKSPYLGREFPCLRCGVHVQSIGGRLINITSLILGRHHIKT